MFYNVETAAIELSVRELLAMAHKSGSLDARHARPTEAMVKGSLLHRKIQEKGGPHYEAEVPLSNTTSFNGIFYTVEGRADGVITEEDGSVTVEKIKARRGRGFTGGPYEDAYSQLRCYAYFIAEARGLRSVKMRMRTVHMVTEEIKDSYSEMTKGELKEFYLGLLSRISYFAEFEVLRRTALIPSVKEVRFPYQNMREGQTELAEQCYIAIAKGKRLFAQAPTGIGKTMSTLYPAVKALGEGMIDRVFYLTAKTSTGRAAYAAAGKLFEAGAKLRTVVLHAKEHMCLYEGGCRNGSFSNCSHEVCPFARGYYNRVDDAIKELLSRQNGFPRKILMEVAGKYSICPYELSLDLSKFCEIIICDYNYVFDPAVYLRRYFDSEEGECGRYAFLVDEAHNLPDRARGMYSATLESTPFEALYAKVDPSADAKLEAILGGFILALHRLFALCTEHREKHEDGTASGYYLNRSPLTQFGETVEQTEKQLEEWLKGQEEHPFMMEVSDLTLSMRRFLHIAEYYDSRFLTYLELQHGVLKVQLFCLDPSGVLHVAANRARAAVYFSATLTPPEYFADILGGGKKAVSLSLPSPYDEEHFCVTVVPKISTRMEDRKGSYRRIATMIAATVSAKAGNYLVYFPSYAYLESVLEQFQKKYPKVTCVVQKRGMSHSEREAFLDSFPADEGCLRVGFCVLGGSFAEGVDLPGSRLIGVVIVGVGIPGISNERNILRDYYENKCERGYDYAYTFPGFNRVLQAAGRVIRREDDRGVAVLIDSRYAEEPYLHLYPAHWKNISVAGDGASLARRMQLFWENEK